MNFQSHISKVGSAIKLWRLRKLTIKEKDFKIISNFQNNLSITYNNGSTRNN